MKPFDRQDARRVTGELEGALRMATMAIPAEGAATLCAPGEASFLDWLGGLFREKLAPHADRVAGLARRGFVREIEEIDRGLRVSGLPEELLRSSAAAGAGILEARCGLRSCPVLSRIAAAVAEGKMPGHHTSVFAAQAAVLHLSVQGILVGLAFDEWRRANRGGGVAEFRRLLPEVTEVAAGIYRGRAGQRFRTA